MRTLMFVLFSIGVAGNLLLAQDKKAPDKLTFTSRNGNIAFNHAEHVAKANQDCKKCHDGLFKEEATAPLDYKAGMHKPAEAAKTSCGACHNPDGPAFESKGNCAKCHVKS